MRHDHENHGVVYNMATSLPVVGAPARFLLDYTRLGISQYGVIRGTLRGGLVGLVMFIAMLTLTEVIPLGWDIVHYYLQMSYVEPIKAEERGMLMESRPAGEHPHIAHWHEKFDVDLGWLNPGRYLLTEHSRPGDWEDK